MSTEENKSQANRIPDAINARDLDSLAQVIAADYVEHQPQPPGTPTGLEGFKFFFETFGAAFPDLRYTVDDTIAEGDLVVQRLTGHGTMKSSFAGMPATGKAAAWSEIHISRLQNGKVVEHWGVVDQMGMLQQLGLAPTPGQP